MKLRLICERESRLLVDKPNGHVSQSEVVLLSHLDNLEEYNYECSSLRNG